MNIMISSNKNNPSHSYNLQSEWTQCCSSILFPTTSLANNNEDGKEETETSKDDAVFPMINLIRLPPSPLSTKHNNANDPLYDNAKRLEESIHDMSTLLRNRAREYADCDYYIPSYQDRYDQRDSKRMRQGMLPSQSQSQLPTTRSMMSESEKTLLETTVLGFTMSTANQIEMLRKQLFVNSSNTANNLSEDAMNHRNGIISNLLHNLRHDVALPMECLQKSRKRGTLQLSHCPLTCRVVSVPSVSAAAGSLEKSLEEEFDGGSAASRKKTNEGVIAAAMEAAIVLTNEEKEEEDLFHSIYNEPCEVVEDDDELEEEFFTGETGEKQGFVTQSNKRNKFTMNVHEEDEEKDASEFTPNVQKVMFNNNNTTTKNETNTKPTPITYQTDNQYNSNTTQENVFNNNPELVEELRQEHLLLTANLQSGEFDAVQKVEERMMEITALLRQFASLVSEQQEDVLLLHENTKTSKKNMDKGQDHLVDATDRNKKSQHRMAKFIWCMALLLLFLNWITP